jgi:hypothetical protein
LSRWTVTSTRTFMPSALSRRRYRRTRSEIDLSMGRTVCRKR